MLYFVSFLNLPPKHSASMFDESNGVTSSSSNLYHCAEFRSLMKL